MMGVLLDQMRAETAYNNGSGGFETDITITDLSGKTAIVKGVAALHNTTVNPENGLAVTGKVGNIRLSVTALESAGFNLYSDSKKPNEISMNKWKVTFADSDSKVFNFVCNDVRPSQTHGIIVIILGAKQ